jgi:hypothetical protein
MADMFFIYSLLKDNSVITSTLSDVQLYKLRYKQHPGESRFGSVLILITNEYMVSTLIKHAFVASH